MKSLISGSDQIGNRCLANRKDEQGGISILLHYAGAVARKEEVVELTPEEKEEQRQEQIRVAMLRAAKAQQCHFNLETESIFNIY